MILRERNKMLQILIDELKETTELLEDVCRECESLEVKLDEAVEALEYSKAKVNEIHDAQSLNQWKLKIDSALLQIRGE